MTLSSGAVHKRRRQLGGVKNWSKLPTDSTKKLPTWGKGGVKNPEKLPTSFMDGPSDNCGWIFVLGVKK